MPRHHALASCNRSSNLRDSTMATSFPEGFLWGASMAAYQIEGAVAEDFACHRAIAEATGNAQFPRFLAFLGSHVIPRQSVRLSVDTPAERRAYLERIQHEHERIVSGISHRDPAEARRAMREHLTRSLERYRELAEGEKHGRG